jgi:hypothetical protein
LIYFAYFFLNQYLDTSSPNISRNEQYSTYDEQKLGENGISYSFGILNITNSKMLSLEEIKNHFDFSAFRIERETDLSSIKSTSLVMENCKDETLGAIDAALEYFKNDLICFKQRKEIYVTGRIEDFTKPTKRIYIQVSPCDVKINPKCVVLDDTRLSQIYFNH